MEPYTNYTLSADDYYENKIAEEQDELNDQLIEFSFKVFSIEIYIRAIYRKLLLIFCQKMKLVKSMGKLRKMNRTSNFEASLIDRIGFDASVNAGAERKIDLIEK